MLYVVLHAANFERESQVNANRTPLRPTANQGIAWTRHENLPLVVNQVTLTLHLFQSLLESGYLLFVLADSLCSAAPGH